LDSSQLELATQFLSNQVETILKWNMKIGTSSNIVSSVNQVKPQESQTQNPKRYKSIVVGSNMTEQDQIDRPSWRKQKKKGFFRKEVLTEKGLTCSSSNGLLS